MKKFKKTSNDFKFAILCLSVIFICKNWFTVLLGLFKIRPFSNRQTIFLTNGLRFNFSHPFDSFTLVEIFFLNEYRFHFSKDIKTVIDIGANCGVFSIFAASFSKKMKVYSYEPSKDAFESLNHNGKINNMNRQIKAFKKAVLSNKRKLSLFGTGPTTTRSIVKNDENKKLETAFSTTLAEIFKTNRIKKCDFLKMDCEGSEYEILLNCSKNILKKIKRIALEYHPYGSKHSYKDLVRVLSAAGFKTTIYPNKIDKILGIIYAVRNDV